ncbi:MAG TPA: TfpX/TfpZ family type IV pilin accessory protein [Steroidobacteraceae bacterium]|nr:TfpX/TfpZ family type IV pilin accessory protein [Steroidobacteraceae bacterium]
MIVWREKFLATAIHFLVTLVLAAIAAALIFLVWFPDPLQTMIGGTELFMLVVGCDLALGPLLSLVIYNSRKSRRELIIDYAVVGTVQIAALVYGVTIVAGTRPVYVAFSADRLEIVTARDIQENELAAALDPAYRTLSLTGPRYVAVVVPPSERNDAVFQALSGNEEHMRPKFFVSYESQLANIRARAKPIEALAQRKPDSRPLLEAAMRDVAIPAERVRWLPVHHRKGFWTALIDNDDGKPVAYFDFDPY